MSLSQPMRSNSVHNAGQAWHWTFLMCPPAHFKVSYEINPWMHKTRQPDFELAQRQWNNLVANLKEVGAAVELLQPIAELPDMVFSADIGIVDQQRFIMSHFRYPQRRPEARLGAEWFGRRNYEVLELPLGEGSSLESSDIASFGAYLLAGYGFRTTLAAHAALTSLLGSTILSIEFIDARFYHLDISFCALDERRAIVVPAAWSRRSCELVEKLIPEPLVLELDEALTFCANAIVVGKTIIMPSCPLRVARMLERWGFTICVSPLSEFLKAGGGPHCLALAMHGAPAYTQNPEQ